MKYIVAVFVVFFCLTGKSAYAWEFKKYEATPEEPKTASFCGIKKDYEEGISLTFVQNTDGQTILFFAFRDFSFKEGSTHMLNVIFKDAKEQLPPKIFRTESDVLQTNLMKTSSFGKGVVLDMLSLYSHVEIILDNKVFNIPLGTEWRSSLQTLKRCSTEIRLFLQEMREENIVDTEDHALIDNQGEPIARFFEESPFLRAVLSKMNIVDLSIYPISATASKWESSLMKGIFLEYNLKNQEGHSTEKLRHIAENTLFSLRRLCQGAFVNEVGRIEHIKDKSFIRADGACSAEKTDTTTAVLFVEIGDLAYVFIQEAVLEQAKDVIEFRNLLLNVIKDL